MILRKSRDSVCAILSAQVVQNREYSGQMPSRGSFRLYPSALGTLYPEPLRAEQPGSLCSPRSSRELSGVQLSPPSVGTMLPVRASRLMALLSIIKSVRVHPLWRSSLLSLAVHPGTASLRSAFVSHFNVWGN